MLIYEEGKRVRVLNNTGSDIQAGQLVKVGNWIGMAFSDIPNGQEGTLVIKGVVEAQAVDPAVEIPSGTPLQFDPSTGKVQPKDPNANLPVIGKAFETKPMNQSTVLVLLMPELY